MEFNRELEGRWIASALDSPHVHVYGATQQEALANSQSLALNVIADEIARGERSVAALLTVGFSRLTMRRAGSQTGARDENQTGVAGSFGTMRHCASRQYFLPARCCWALQWLLLPTTNR